MEDTVDKLEVMFQKAESDLHLIHRKLDNECNAQCAGVDLDEANQVKLLERVSAIKEEYKGIVEDAKQIQEAQAEAMLFFKDALSKACQALMQLQVNSGLQDEKPEELARVEELLGLNIQDLNIRAVQPTESTSCNSQHEFSQCQTERKTQGGTAPPAATQLDVEQIDLSPYEKRCGSTEFIEITDAEFETVSSLIRGRVQLSDVNSTYQFLWLFFKENKESETLTPSDMHKMGLRVTGKTGDAKLKVLRALKLLSISKTGDVQLL